MGDDVDDPDPSLIFVGVVLLAILFLALLRFCDFLCTRGRQREDDEEHLDPSIEINGCWSLSTCCCSQVSEKKDEGQKVEQEQQQQGNGGVSIRVHAPELSPIHFPPGLVTEEEETGQPQTQVVPSKSSMDANSFSLTLKHLQHLQKVEQQDTGVGKEARIRMVQNLLQLEMNRPTEKSMNSALIIGVDATPKILGGYCVNLREMRMEYYVIKMEDLPWPMENLNDPVEFEMKNLLFALAVWSGSIRKFKSFRVYTDNNGICGTSEVGLEAETLIKHFTRCEGAVLANKEMWVNRNKDLAGFAKYIQPADDLSRWKVDKAVDFLCKFYGIRKNRAKGTVKLTRHGTTETKPWYDPSDAYQATLIKAKIFATKFQCDNCVVSSFF